MFVVLGSFSGCGIEAIKDSWTKLGARAVRCPSFSSAVRGIFVLGRVTPHPNHHPVYVIMQ